MTPSLTRIVAHRHARSSWSTTEIVKSSVRSCVLLSRTPAGTTYRFVWARTPAMPKHLFLNHYRFDLCSDMAAFHATVPSYIRTGGLDPSLQLAPLWLAVSAHPRAQQCSCPIGIGARFMDVVARFFSSPCSESFTGSDSTYLLPRGVRPVSMQRSRSRLCHPTAVARGRCDRPRDAGSPISLAPLHQRHPARVIWVIHCREIGARCLGMRE